MSYNNTHILTSLSSPSPHPSPRHPIPSSPFLPLPLPSSSTLEAESLIESVKEYQRQSLQLSRETELARAVAEQQALQAREEVKEKQGTWGRLIVGKGKGKGGQPVQAEGKTKGFERTPDAYELYAAIDRKDIMSVAIVCGAR